MNAESPPQLAREARRLSAQPGSVPEDPGRGVAIVGPPGAGKTTRLVALACAYRRREPTRAIVAVSRSAVLLDALRAAGAVGRIADLSNDLGLLLQSTSAGVDVGIVARDDDAWRAAATAGANLRFDPARELLLLLDDAEAASDETAAALAKRPAETALLLAWRPTGRPTDAWLLDLVGTTILLGGWAPEDHVLLQELGLVERAGRSTPAEPQLSSPQWESLVQSAMEHTWDVMTVRKLAARAREALSAPHEAAHRLRFDRSADWVELYRELR